ncbi:MAG: family 43 glycosylhydrolase [Haliscomenobacter sp.]|nr:family 43 glycosylhydrolase [Haliscomenobacter sp.]MBK8652496.1 family 43 glycosylhydrolase [Haliscomenobacter sp.]MBP9075213.1 family 43 glycosylhydrolase [Haliscomenobacter sp.]MBP9872386.1 family 43 glycosylhydrolase [Haliscomenobacter sp.]
MKTWTFLFVMILVLEHSFSAIGQDWERFEKVKMEGQPLADQGNGFFLNPILSGNYGDPSIVRRGNDYFMAFSRGDGMILWHSRDLVNWTPVIRHFLPEGYQRVWAVDLQYFKDQFYLYMPINSYPGRKEGETGFGNFVITAKNPEGPWSEPIKIDIPKPPGIDHWGAIDPGVIRTPGGKFFLYLSAGWALPLDESGTKSTGHAQKVYDGWEYPASWNVECKCLESPKLFFKDGYFFLVSAQGGTNGPSTAHMTIVARSKSPLGPWENSPFNPLTHTYSEDERWWHQGHGTIFEATDGSWWTVFHGRLKNYTGLGRATLLMPVEWTPDGWPVIKDGFQPWNLIPKPPGENIGHGFPLSDSFLSSELGPLWHFDNAKKMLFKPGNGQLQVTATGNNHRDGTLLTLGAVNNSFEVTVEIELPGEDATAGLALENDGLVFNGRSATFTEGPDWRMNQATFSSRETGHIFFKIRNFRKDISLFYSDDGAAWTSFGKGIRREDSYRIKLFAAGTGQAVFRNFKYTGLE